VVTMSVLSAWLQLSLVAKLSCRMCSRFQTSSRTSSALLFCTLCASHWHPSVSLSNGTCNVRGYSCAWWLHDDGLFHDALLMLHIKCVLDTAAAHEHARCPHVLAWMRA
jgi:hypothetical protein